MKNLYDSVVNILKTENGATTKRVSRLLGFPSANILAAMEKTGLISVEKTGHGKTVVQIWRAK